MRCSELFDEPTFTERMKPFGLRTIAQMPRPSKTTALRLSSYTRSMIILKGIFAHHRHLKCAGSPTRGLQRAGYVLTVC